MANPEIRAAIEAAVERHDEARWRAKLAELAADMSKATDAMKATGETAKQAANAFDRLAVIWQQIKYEYQPKSTSQRGVPTGRTPQGHQMCYCHDLSCTRIPHKPFIVDW